MLVLARLVGESIVIDNRIKVTIVDIRHDNVRLGITAPADVPVHRQEVQDAILASGESAREVMDALRLERARSRVQRGECED